MYMPYKKRLTKGRKKNIRRGKKRRTKRSMGRITRRPILEGFPYMHVAKLRYVETGLALNPPVGGLASWIYRATSIYDPNYSLGAVTPQHQPCGYDQWAQVYKKYKVLSARCTFQIIPSGTSLEPVIYYGIGMSTDPTLPLSFNSVDSVLESKLTSGFNIYGPIAWNNRGKGPQCVKTYSGKKFWRDPLFGTANGTRYESQMDDNPNGDYQVYFNVVVMSSADLEDAPPVQCSVKIDYIVQMWDPVLLQDDRASPEDKGPGGDPGGVVDPPVGYINNMTGATGISP